EPNEVRATIPRKFHPIPKTPAQSAKIRQNEFFFQYLPGRIRVGSHRAVPRGRIRERAVPCLPAVPGSGSLAVPRGTYVAPWVGTAVGNRQNPRSEALFCLVPFFCWEPLKSLVRGLQSVLRFPTADKEPQTGTGSHRGGRKVGIG